jgi:hypothetical protein
MAPVRNNKGSFSVVAYQGDAKTLLAFNLDQSATKKLAGFTIQYTTADGESHFIHNKLQFEKLVGHAHDPSEPAYSSINAPIHKFRWIHVPGSVHQGLKPFLGQYTYTVTPRYFDKNSLLLPLDSDQSVSVPIDVVPFQKGNLRLGFARGFTQSEAFVTHFGKNALIRPKGNELLFDTSQISGSNAKGDKFTFSEEYDWLGWTAREQVFSLLNEVLQDASLRVDMFAYDLNESDVMKILLRLATQGRVRVILDNAALHHNSKDTDNLTPKPEDQFEQAFVNQMQGEAAILRGKFGRYAHDKIFIVSNNHGPIKVLTGSTNFSITGLYVNSNHVILFDEPEVATVYAKVFEEAWNGKVSKKVFQTSELARRPFQTNVSTVPPTQITFSPHLSGDVDDILSSIVNCINAEAARPQGGSILFAVMELDNGNSPVYEALCSLHENQSIFSYGISDNPKGIYMYKPGNKTGVLVSGKPASTVLPPPFDQVRGVGAGHQVHHKFVICGFNQPDAVVFCGSSNLASGGEAANGDNLLTIHDPDVATAFAIEALGLVDHFIFLDNAATGGKGSTPSKRRLTPAAIPASSLKHAAIAAGWFLSTDDLWTKPYYDPTDLKYVDRMLFG